MAYANTPLNANNPLYLGETFSSHDEFKQRLEEHKLATMSDYWIRDCRTLGKAVSQAPRALQAPPDLKYYYLKLSCIYGGQNFKSKQRISTKRRFVGSFRQGCKAKILLALTKDCQSLVVKQIDHEHNHKMNPSILRLKPGSTAAKAKRINGDAGLQLHANNIVYEGFVYQKVPTVRNGKQYLKCVVNLCPGRAIKIIGEDGINSVEVTKNHAHEADRHALDRLQFVSKMKRRAEKEAVSLRKIFDAERYNFPEVWDEADFKAISKMLFVSRKKAEPPVPKTMRELGFMLVSEDWRYRYGCNLEEPPKELFVGVVRGTGGEGAAVFASLYLCAKMNKPIAEIHIDTSYKNLPDKPPDMKFLLSIHFVEDGHSFAGVYAVMSSRNLAACLAVLKFVRDELLPECAPEVIYTGFEAELQLACREVFPEATTQGTCYYYSKDVWDKCQSLKLLDLPHQDVLLGIVRACMSLPLLPASLMESGLNAVAAMLARSELGNSITLQLVQHVRYSWLEAVGSSELSAVEHPQRSNQNIQNFHQELDYFAAKKELTTWRFIEILQQIEQCHRKSHESLLQGARMKPLRQATLSVQDPKVELAATQLTSGEIGICEFLSAASCTVERMTLQLLEDEPTDHTSEEQQDSDLEA